MTDFDSELERRLRADAARRDAADVEPPSLTDALSTVTMRRRVPLTWLAVAATVLLVAGLALAFGLHGTGDGQSSAGSLGTDPPPPPPSGVPTESDGQRLFYFNDAGFNGVVLDPDDPRVLGVVVPYSNTRGECSLFGATARIVAQDSQQVVLTASGFQYLNKSAAHRKYSGFQCTGGGVAVVRVRLNAPLGNRLIYDGQVRAGNGIGPAPSPIGPADPGDLPAPSYLPAGYAPGRTSPASLRTGQLVGQRYYTGPGAKLVLQVGPPTEVQGLSKTAVGRGRVGGARATITAEPHVRCISWAESAGLSARTRQLCSYADPTLSNAELLRIARSVR